jgi:ribosomal protein S18 acetylase RimI-like enzyme
MHAIPPREFGCIELFHEPSTTPQIKVDRLSSICRNQPYAPSKQQIEDFFRHHSSTSTKLCVTVSQRSAENQEHIQGAVFWNIVLNQAELEYLVVHPEARRQGIGRQLMNLSQAALENCGVTECVLEVAPSNTAAIKLYQSLGYSTIGKRAGYYSTGEDALVMRTSWN